MRSARDDNGAVGGCLCQARQIRGVGREDAVTWAGEQDDCGIDRITCTGDPEQDAGLAAFLRAYRTYIDCAKQLGQALAPVAFAPDLGDHHGVAALFHAVLRGHPKPGEHRPVAAVDSHQGARIQD